MKVARWIICAAAASIGLASCTDSVGPVKEFPTFYGTWAGKTWVGDASASLVPGGSNGDTLYISGSKPAGAGLYSNEMIIAKVVIHGPGVYLLGPGDARLDEVVGGDVVAATYSTTGTSVGRVTITSYNGAHGLVEGKIEFDAETTSPYGSYGSKSSLRDAFYSAVVKTVSQN
jgi:hypothetical protein